MIAATAAHAPRSLLTGVIVVVAAMASGEGPPLAVRLGGSMLLLQLAVGVIGSLAQLGASGAGDRPRQTTWRPGRWPGITVAVACGGAGLALASAGGPVSILLAVAVLAVGTWHRLVASATRLSWVAVALGVPGVPLFGWLGGAGSMTSALVVLVAAAAAAGAALAIASSAADVERDRAGGRRSVAVEYGPARAAAAALGLETLVAVMALVAGRQLGASGPWLSAAGLASVVPVAAAALGLVASGRGRGWREAAFDAQAIGLALLAVAWVNAVSSAAT